MFYFLLKAYIYLKLFVLQRTVTCKVVDSWRGWSFLTQSPLYACQLAFKVCPQDFQRNISLRFIFNLLSVFYKNAVRIWVLPMRLLMNSSSSFISHNYTLTFNCSLFIIIIINNGYLTLKTMPCLLLQLQSSFRGYTFMTISHSFIYMSCWVVNSCGSDIS